MIEDFSEPGGTFRYENFISNERSIQYVIPELKARPKPGGVYLGVAPEQNFTYIAAIEPKIAFIIDIRRQNMLVHMLYKALFELSPNRADFVARLFSRKRPAGLNEIFHTLKQFLFLHRIDAIVERANAGQNNRARVIHAFRIAHDAHVRANFEQRLLHAAQISRVIINQCDHKVN